MGDFLRDVRQALRLFSAQRGFTVIAVLTLAIGIGASTAIFSVVNAVLLRPLPYPNADRIVRVHSDRSGPAGQRMNAFVTDVLLKAWSEEGETLEQIAAYAESTYTIRVSDAVERIRGTRVSPSMFPLLRTTPQLGRLFLPDEAEPGASPVVLLSDRLWRSRFGADPNVVGQVLILDSRPHAIVGVLPADFYFPDRETLLWTPQNLTSPALPDGGRLVMLVPALARIRPDVTVAQAEAEGTAIRRGAEQRMFGDSDAPTLRVQLVPLQEELIAETRPALLVLFAGVMVVVLITVVNLANLLLARGVARARELAIRAAVGASRWRLVRQLLTESLVLSVAGGVLGLLAAYWGHDLLLSVAPGDIPRVAETSFDSIVFGFGVGLSVVTGLVCGSVPALHSSGQDLIGRANLGARTSAGVLGRLRATRTRAALASVEIALAVVLVVVAGLLVRSFDGLVDIDPGYDPAGVLTARVHIPRPDQGIGLFAITPTERRALVQADIARFDQILDRVGGLPGVLATGLTSLLPLVAGGYEMPVEVVGRSAPTDPAGSPRARLQVTSPSYHDTMGIPLIDGRLLTNRERTGAPRAILVNETFARLHLQPGRPVGQRLTFGENDETPWEIVGVVGDVRHTGLTTEPESVVYRSYRQDPSRPLSYDNPQVAVRVEGDPSSVVPFLREAVNAVHTDAALGDVMTMESRLSASVTEPRFNAILLSFFGLTALALAAIGIYGVLAHSVSQRRREVGVRVALGALRRDILRVVLRQAGAVVALGLISGLMGSLAVTRLLDNLLFGVAATDPATFIMAPVLLMVVAALACYFPARRATRVDPMVVLRHE